MILIKSCTVFSQPPGWSDYYVVEEIQSVEVAVLQVAEIIKEWQNACKFKRAQVSVNDE